MRKQEKVPIVWLSSFFSVPNYFSWIVKSKLRCESVGCPPVSGGGGPYTLVWSVVGSFVVVGLL